jgi:hypothetical protein
MRTVQVRILSEQIAYESEKGQPDFQKTELDSSTWVAIYLCRGITELRSVQEP